MLINGKKKRIGIYCFYDQFGEVDGYVEYLLNDLKTNLDRLVIVINGTVTEKGKIKLSKLSNEIIIRENKGFDVWACKEAIDIIGWTELCRIDELVVVNSTFYGPLFHLNEIFEEMASRDIDFWGITRHYGSELDFSGANPYKCIPEHIQTYFIVYRKKLISSTVFKNYWNNCPRITSYSEAIGLYETYLTKYFSEEGFSWDTWVNSDVFKKYTAEPLRTFPLELIRDKRCPFIKRRIFFSDRIVTLKEVSGPNGNEIIQYLKSFTKYNTDLIYENIIRTCNMSDIVSNLNLLNIVSSTVPSETELNAKDIALVLHLFYEDLAKHYLSRALNFPKDCMIIITSSSPMIRKFAREQQNIDNNHKYEIIEVENQGRDISALWVGAKKIASKYKIVCFIHDKKSGQATPGSVGITWGNDNLKNLSKNECYINNIINLFVHQKYLGLIVTLPPAHGEYISIYNHLWGTNFNTTKEFLKSLDIRVPISEEKDPVTAYGSCYWFRTEALKDLFKIDWSYNDFPQEPLAIDGTISHAIERSLPFIAQNNGFYTGIVVEEHEAEKEILNLSYYLRRGIEVTTPSYTRYLEKEVQKYYQQTSLKWQVKHRIMKLFHHKDI